MFKVNEQVCISTKMREGSGLKQVRIGTILAFRDGGKTAIVSIPADRVRRTISVSELTPVSERYGRARVQINPTNRNISSLIRK